MTPDVFPVLLAGGIGSRFWPISRARRPKQMLDLFGDGPMLSVTLARVAPLGPPENTLVVTSTALADDIRQLLSALPPANILAEPVGRNTAPAIAWAALEALARHPDPVLAVLPADHHIADVAAFHETATAAISLARAGHIVTLGIPPTHPETGYGYIQRGEPLATSHAFRVTRFVEKPDLPTAANYLAAGGFDWNAGMFFMRARVLLDELAQHRPDLHAAICGAQDIVAAWPNFPSISIDYAVMEKSERVVVLPGFFGWSDVGSWRSLWDHRGAAETTFARGDVLEIDGGGNVLFADGGLLCTMGVKDLVVVHTPDVTFVCPRDEAQRVREAVAKLLAAGREEVL